METNSPSQCQACHGLDYRGTVLSRMQASRTLNAFGTKTLFRGAVIGCYTCHNGPGNDSANTNAPPTVNNVSTNTPNDQAVAMVLPATGSSLTLRIIAQPTNGVVGLAGNVATYFPNPGYVGSDAFTFAAYDGAKNSNLGTGSVAVAQGPISLGVAASAPPAYPAGWPVAFSAVASATNSAAAVAFDWDFGDGSAHGTSPYSGHAYAQPGNYAWRVVATVPGASATATGTLSITGPMGLMANFTPATLTLTWPLTLADAVVEQTVALGASTEWSPVTNIPFANAGTWSLSLPRGSRDAFFRLRQAQ